MEILFQFFDEVDDFIIATAVRLQRLLSPSPRERRQVPRTRLTLPSSQHPLLAESGQVVFTKLSTKPGQDLQAVARLSFSIVCFGVRQMRYQQGNKQFADTRFHQVSRGFDGLGTRKN